jgi:uncharacterized protein (DUF1697 family)
MIYVALLRGINVGGNSKIEMNRLKALFESLGLEDVTTYINSGNIIFSSHKDPELLDTTLENAIESEFKIKVPVVIKDQNTILNLIKKIPDHYTNDTEQKTDVIFLWKEVDSKKTLEELIIKPDYDRVEYISGAIVWNVLRKDVNKSGLLKIVGTQLYKKITIRNINTVRKIALLMDKIKS